MINIIPRPRFVEERLGEFNVTRDTTVYADDRLVFARDKLIDAVESACGFRLHVAVTKKADICFFVDPHIPKEGYVLEADTEKMTIRASHIAGAFYAVQSFRQITLSDILDAPEMLSMHAIKIVDEPKYAYRGLMFDEARYFHGADTVKSLLDMMALFKLNVLHWHLTDNEGWRIEIKKYPKLVEIGSHRRGSQNLAWGNKSIDWTEHDGFYTQTEIKEIVAYAARRNITIVPEIDMPAHMGAAIASYPWLSCGNVHMQVPIIHGGTPETNGVGDIIACAGKETTYQFIYDVIDELATLFPAPYFHIGGDEAPKKEWKKCPCCQQAMAEAGLKDEEELQGYFNNKIAVYLQRKGKRMIGWNEILRAKNLENSVIAEYWTPMNDPEVQEYLEQGKDVVIAKHQAFYFDMPYAQNRLKTTYEFTPEKYGLKSENGGILGVEGALWTEWVSSDERIWFQLFPRMQALSEVAWTDEKLRHYRDFAKRLKRMLPLFDKMGLGYCPVSMWNAKNPFKRAKTMHAFYKKNAHIEFNRAVLIQKRRRYKF